MLQLEKLQKQYGNFTALDIESFTIKDGIVWLQGENGSGKTTLLKTMAGLLPFKGDIMLNSTYSIKKQRQQFLQLVNYGETEPLYPAFLTGKELVKLYCHAKKGDIGQAEDMLKQLHVYEAYNKPVATYSSGMVKKLSLTLAFIGTPKWILLDEPLVAVDAASVETVCSIIKSKHEKDGISFLITSHQAFYVGQLSFTAALLATNHTVKHTGE
jgi:ABC-2 type transport system ATP-binding protein